MAHYTKSSEAYRDITEQANFLAQRSLDVALRFLDAIEQTADVIASSPEMGGICQFRNPRAVGMRVWQVRGFPNHLIFCRVVAEGIDIVRVLHGARDLDAIFE